MAEELRWSPVHWTARLSLHSKLVSTHRRPLMNEALLLDMKKETKNPTMTEHVAKVLRINSSDITKQMSNTSNGRISWKLQELRMCFMGSFFSGNLPLWNNWAPKKNSPEHSILILSSSQQLRTMASWSWVLAPVCYMSVGRVAGSQPSLFPFLTQAALLTELKEPRPVQCVHLLGLSLKFSFHLFSNSLYGMDWHFFDIFTGICVCCSMISYTCCKCSQQIANTLSGCASDLAKGSLSVWTFVLYAKLWGVCQDFFSFLFQQPRFSLWVSCNSEYIPVAFHGTLFSLLTSFVDSCSESEKQRFDVWLATITASPASFFKATLFAPLSCLANFLTS